MYGNNFDYGNPKLDTVRNQVDDIMASTRDAVSNLGTGSTYDSIQAGMGDALANAGVGNVSSFLAEAYTPNVPTSTPSYSSFMADTPQRIQDSIAAKQVAYNAGQADRMKDFQDLLKEVKRFLNVFAQTIIAPAVTTLLFYLIFQTQLEQSQLATES